MQAKYTKTFDWNNPVEIHNNHGPLARVLAVHDPFRSYRKMCNFERKVPSPREIKTKVYVDPIYRRTKKIDSSGELFDMLKGKTIKVIRRQSNGAPLLDEGGSEMIEDKPISEMMGTYRRNLDALNFVLKENEIAAIEDLKPFLTEPLSNIGLLLSFIAIQAKQNKADGLILDEGDGPVIESVADLAIRWDAASADGDVFGTRVINELASVTSSLVESKSDVETNPFSGVSTMAGLSVDPGVAFNITLSEDLVSAGFIEHRFTTSSEAVKLFNSLQTDLTVTRIIEPLLGMDLTPTTDDSKIIKQLSEFMTRLYDVSLRQNAIVPMSSGLYIINPFLVDDIHGRLLQYNEDYKKHMQHPSSTTSHGNAENKKIVKEVQDDVANIKDDGERVAGNDNENVYILLAAVLKSIGKFKGSFETIALTLKTGLKKGGNQPTTVAATADPESVGFEQSWAKLSKAERNMVMSSYDITKLALSFEYVLAGDLLDPMVGSEGYGELLSSKSGVSAVSAD